MKRGREIIIIALLGLILFGYFFSSELDVITRINTAESQSNNELREIRFAPEQDPSFVCTDSDGGLVPEIKGEVCIRATGESYAGEDGHGFPNAPNENKLPRENEELCAEDYCFVNGFENQVGDVNGLVEHTCMDYFSFDPIVPIENIINCEHGCVDGRCIIPECGNLIVESGEHCDDGGANSDTEPDACRTNCRVADCGDEVIDSGETCDDGLSNGNPNFCNLLCDGITESVCGNGVQESGEECDEGEANSDANADSCRTDCILPICGDLVVDSGETCDDGNTISGDGCNQCVVEGCGDGIHQPLLLEECDDGNLNDNDACTNACTSAECGDGVVWDTQGGSEECDAGPLGDSQCSEQCTLTICGDFEIQSPNGFGVFEICDQNSIQCIDENGYSGIANCDSSCTEFLECNSEEFCGDGTVNGNEECDGEDGLGEYESCEECRVVDNCNLVAANFDSTIATGGEVVGLQVAGENCNGESIRIDLEELDEGAESIFGGNDEVTEDFGLVRIEGSVGETEWVAQLQNDCLGLCDPSEYSFTATLVSDSDESITSNRLTVIEPPEGSTCVIEKAYWLEESSSLVEVFEGEEAVMIVETENCESGETITFNIYEEDEFANSDEEIAVNYLTVDITGNYGVGTWETIYYDDCSGTCNPSEHYFTATLDNEQDETSSNRLTVKQQDSDLCGDGNLDLNNNEQCDDGNNIESDLCDNQCQVTYCGDGTIQLPNGASGLYEQCDDGSNNGLPGFCPDDCIINSEPFCGDGYLGEGEQCDDGNEIPGDGCNEICMEEFCGDGIHQPLIGEHCDDGNSIDDDSCNNNCIGQLSCQIYDGGEAGNLFTESQILVSGENITHFGTAVDMEGNLMAVGAPNLFNNGDFQNSNGKVYLFEKSSVSGLWTTIQNISPNNALPGGLQKFGSSLILENDELIIGATRKSVPDPDDHIDMMTTAGVVYIYENNEVLGEWTEKQVLIPNHEYLTWSDFGYSLSKFGDTLIVGSPNGNDAMVYVYQFDQEEDMWVETQKLQPSTYPSDISFGYSLDIYENRIIVGAPDLEYFEGHEGTVFIFEYDSESNFWFETEILISSDFEGTDKFGSQVKIFEDQILVSSPWNYYYHPWDWYEPRAGSVYSFIYDDQMNLWNEQQIIFSPNPNNAQYFGANLEINDLGNKMIIGGAHDGFNLYEFNGLNWVYVQHLATLDGDHGDDHIHGNGGNAIDPYYDTIAFEGNEIAIGAYRLHSWQAFSAPGTVHYFEIQGTCCGNGMVEDELGEACDDGVYNLASGQCSNICQVTFCGDGVIQYPNGMGTGGPLNNGEEECEVNGLGLIEHQACVSCEVIDLTYCGDGTMQTPNDEGIGGPLNDGDEACDDGNDNNFDLCNEMCESEFCGNGIPDTVIGETCDDNNLESGDGCNSLCQVEFCGDGIVQPLLDEQCDDGNGFNGDTCNNACEIVFPACFETTPNLDIMYIIDTSGSMAHPRITDAKEATTNFVNELDYSKDRAGLTSFNSVATLEQTLTNNQNLLLSSINGLQTTAATNMYDGLETGRVNLVSNGRSDADWYMVLLSDGVPSLGEDPRIQADIAKAQGIKIFTIGIDIPEGSLGDDLLIEIASEPSMYYSAVDSQDIYEIYAQIAQGICE